MTSFTIKYRNYSGGGSCIEENPDFETYYLVKPPSFDNEVIVTTTIYPTDEMASTKSMTLHCLNELENISEKDSLKNHQRDLMFGIPINSSQESSFEGFGTSPFGKLHHLLYANQAHKQCQNEMSSPKKDKNHDSSQKLDSKPSPGKVLFSKFYDTIIEENSCNAVDLQISKDSGNSSSITCREGTESSSNSNNSDLNPSSELSFNGKIKILNPTQETSDDCLEKLDNTEGIASLLETSVNVTQQFSESFILKKYSNEKSPDLFGEDEDDEEEHVECHHQEIDGGGKQTEDNKIFTQFLKTVPEHVTNTLTEAVSNSNLADNSFNFPAESSFANDDQTLDYSTIQSTSGTSSDCYTLFIDNCRREREMLRRIRKCLAGVLPPPSVTIPQLDLVSVVLSKKDDIFSFLRDVKSESTKQIDCTDGASSSSRPPSLLRPSHSLEETKTMPWREILGVRQHGLCYNLNKASENNEYLSLAVMERFIGAETASTYTNSPSSAKKRSTRLKLLSQSPGNRLSHLAKRRAIFSSANLATQKNSALVGPQILLNKKKVKNHRKATPKRMTPASKKKNRAASVSSASKRFSAAEIIKSGPSRETSKRALFQSPAKLLQQKTAATKPPAMKPEIANRVEKSKRALLFTPEKQHRPQNNEHNLNSSSSYFAPSTTTQLDLLLKRKRNQYDDCDDAELTSQSAKLFKSSNSSSNITPRSLKIKSESFCIGAGSSRKYKQQLPCASSSSTKNFNTSLCSIGSSSSSSNSQQHLARAASVSSLLGSKLQKSYSESMAHTNSLTENQKKKLLWAVSQALQEKKITTKHENFKEYASILARVVRRIFQEFYQKSTTSNSETMLRLAKKYVYPVAAGSTADDVYLQAKTQIEDTKRQSLGRISGYIGPEEYQHLKQQSSQSLFTQLQSHKGTSQKLFAADSSFDSFGLLSQTSSSFCESTNCVAVQAPSSFLGQISQNALHSSDNTLNTNSCSATKTIQTNAALQNSSSKSNLCGVVLRENVDCEVRRSAQKNFTGKDQRNMSPYAAANSGSAVKAQTQLVADLAATGAKARRQITFDV